MVVSASRTSSTVAWRSRTPPSAARKRLAVLSQLRRLRGGLSEATQEAASASSVLTLVPATARTVAATTGNLGSFDLVFFPFANRKNRQQEIKQNQGCSDPRPDLCLIWPFPDLRRPLVRPGLRPPRQK